MVSTLLSWNKIYMYKATFPISDFNVYENGLYLFGDL